MMIRTVKIWNSNSDPKVPLSYFIISLQYKCVDCVDYRLCPLNNVRSYALAVYGGLKVTRLKCHSQRARYTTWQ
jgi:hypothetical protein